MGGAAAEGGASAVASLAAAFTLAAFFVSLSPSLVRVAALAFLETMVAAGDCAAAHSARC